MPQRQKFHTDDVKSVQNLVRKSDWATWYCSYIVLAIVWDQQTKDKHLQSPNVNAMKAKKNSQYFWNMFFFRRSIWVFLEFVHRKKQNFTIFDLEKHKIEQIYIWSPMTTWLIMLIFIISVDFPSLRHKHLPLGENIPKSAERGGRAVFAG